MYTRNTSTSFHCKFERSNLGFCEVKAGSPFKKAWFRQPAGFGTLGLRQASKNFKDENRPELVTLLMENVTA